MGVRISVVYPADFRTPFRIGGFMATSSIIYLNSLKQSSGYSWAKLSEGTGIPQSTIRDIFSGKTACPSFETLTKLVVCMDGDMSCIVDNKIEQGEEPPVTDIIAAITSAYEGRIKDLKESAQKLSDSLTHDRLIWMVVALGLLALIVFFLVWDITHPTMGYIQY